MNAKAPSPAQLSRRSILDLAHDEARSFLLKPESYCSLDLPPYIGFVDLIDGVHEVLGGKRLTELRRSNPRDHDDVNYTILHNKDGRYAWRPFQLIHPALYVSLVHVITEEASWQLIRERFQQFAANDQYRSDYPFIADGSLKNSAYHLVNTSVTWSSPSDKFDVQLYAKNLGNKYYFTGASGGVVGNDIMYPGAPRTVGMTLGYHY